MIDELLFQRGHINVKINDEVEDYDIIIADHYFKEVLGLTGEVIDSNGSEYELLSLNGEDFEIVFTFGELDFGINIGIGSYHLDELVVKCTGTIIQEDDCDVLDVGTFDVISVN